jgi:hypothetical protein
MPGPLGMPLTPPLGSVEKARKTERNHPPSDVFCDNPLRLCQTKNPRWLLSANGVTYYNIGAPGFEPGTSCSQSRRATGLRHTPWIMLLDELNFGSVCYQR